MSGSLLFPLLIVFMIGMLFVSSRQRKKQAAAHEALQNSVHVGDVVVMTSGISGTVVDTDDEKTIDLEIAPDVITTWLRAAVREKLNPEAPEDTTGTLPGTAATPASAATNGSTIDPPRSPVADAPTVVTPPAEAVGGTPTSGATRTEGTAAGSVPTASASTGSASTGSASNGSTHRTDDALSDPTSEPTVPRSS